MHQRYFLIEPLYSDPDIFCHFVVGSDRVRASIRIYTDLQMLYDVCSALKAPFLKQEPPVLDRFEDGDHLFNFILTVQPHEGKDKHLRFQIFQDFLDDGAPYRADIRFVLSAQEAETFADALKEWCANPVCAFVWKGD